MFRALLALVRVARQAWLIELAGAGLIVAGAYVAYGSAAALVAGGVGLVLKAFELDGDG